ncbi:MAG: hydantoinase B/oxoprolinase family protein [Candidatus Dormibacteraceae bacterium]
MTFDPITLEVIRSALLAATEEMGATLRRSAYSTNVKTRGDFSCCFLDRHLRVIAQSFAQPVHLGNLVQLVPAALRAYGLDRLGEGDMVVVNDPYLGNIHLNDVTVIAPVYYRDHLFGYLANLAHHVDVGGGAPASIGAFREIYQEGVQIPPVKLVDHGQVVDDTFRLVLAQIRSRRETSGDFRAQIAANITGAARLSELLDHWGLDTVERTIDTVVDVTRRWTQIEIQKLPHGTFRDECYLDSDGYTTERVRLVAAVTVSDRGVEFDLTGSDLQRPAPVNASFGPIYSACAYALKALTDPNLPVNDGFYDLVRVIAPPGTVVNATHPAPMVGGGEVQIRLTDLLFKIFSQSMPERVPAGCKAMQCHAGFGGMDYRSGEYYAFLETLAGGYGGRVESDGPDAVQSHGQNTENAPIEETEASYPVRITRYELIPDSGGAGRRRGGLGLRRDYLFPGPTTFTILADRELEGPWGLFGGKPGHVAEYVLHRGETEHRLPSKTTIELKSDDVVSYRTCGGGGYGPPWQREADRVLADVIDGKVTSSRAQSDYGVVITEHVIDFEATQRLRAKLAAEVDNG